MMLVKQSVLAYLSFFLVVNSVIAEPHNIEFGNGQVLFVEQQMKIEVEIARNRLQRKVGLMNRYHLARDKGMLFIFNQSKVLRVWMKNTYIPLDVIFLSSNGNVVSIVEKLEPCNKLPCEITKSSEIAKLMLEVNAGFVKRLGIKKGQQVILGN